VNIHKGVKYEGQLKRPEEDFCLQREIKGVIAFMLFS
jgi:hypothetical protein